MSQSLHILCLTDELTDTVDRPADRVKIVAPRYPTTSGANESTDPDP